MDNKDFTGLIIRENSLINRFWVPPVFKDDDSDEIIKEGYYKEDDVTDNLPFFLARTCIIEQGTTLRDIFKLLHPHKKILRVIFHQDWFEDWLEYGLNSPINTLSKVPDRDDLEVDCWEISTCVEHDTGHKYKKDRSYEYGIYNTDMKIRKKIRSEGDVSEPSTEFFMDFHMLSKPLTANYISKEYGYTKENIGEQIQIGFFGSDIATLMDYPVILKDSLSVSITSYDDNDDYILKCETWDNFCGFRLFDIIATIFYEISFHGSPEMAKKDADDIYSMVDEIKSKEK